MISVSKRSGKVIFTFGKQRLFKWLRYDCMLEKSYSLLRLVQEFGGVFPKIQS